MTSDEHKAVERAQAALSTLTPATARNDAIAFDLRYARRLVAAGRSRCLFGCGGRPAIGPMRLDAGDRLRVGLGLAGPPRLRLIVSIEHLGRPRQHLRIAAQLRTVADMQQDKQINWPS
jgi:hypothetical protein